MRQRPADCDVRRLDPGNGIERTRVDRPNLRSGVRPAAQTAREVAMAPPSRRSRGLDELAGNAADPADAWIPESGTLWEAVSAMPSEGVCAEASAVRDGSAPRSAASHERARVVHSWRLSFRAWTKRDMRPDGMIRAPKSRSSAPRNPLTDPGDSKASIWGRAGRRTGTASPPNRIRPRTDGSRFLTREARTCRVGPFRRRRRRTSAGTPR